MERRFRWNLRQVIAAVDETRRATDGVPARDTDRRFIDERLDALRAFATGIDAAIEPFGRGEAVDPDSMIRGSGGRKERR